MKERIRYIIDWYREIFGWRFVLEWLDYLPFFFTHAPVRKWHTYFASSWRVATSATYYKKEMAKCGDNVFEQAQRSADLEEAAQESYRENRSKSMRKRQRAIGV